MAHIDQGFDEPLPPRLHQSTHVLGLAPCWTLRGGQRSTLSHSVAGATCATTVRGLRRPRGRPPHDWQKRLAVRRKLRSAAGDGLDVSLSSPSSTRHQQPAVGRTRPGVTWNVFRGRRPAVGDTTKAAFDQILDWEIKNDIDHLITGLTATYAPTSDLTNRLTVGYDRAASGLWQLRPFGFVFAPNGILADTRWVSRVVTVDYAGSLVRPITPGLRGTFSWGGQSVSSEVERDADYGETFSGPGPAVIDSAALRVDFHDRARVVNGGAFAQVLLDWRTACS